MPCRRARIWAFLYFPLFSKILVSSTTCIVSLLSLWVFLFFGRGYLHLYDHSANFLRWVDRLVPGQGGSGGQRQRQAILIFYVSALGVSLVFSSLSHKFFLTRKENYIDNLSFFLVTLLFQHGSMVFMTFLEAGRVESIA